MAYTYSEMIFDGGMYIAFYLFGIVSCAGIFWIEGYVERRRNSHDVTGKRRTEETRP